MKRPVLVREGAEGDSRFRQAKRGCKRRHEEWSMEHSDYLCFLCALCVRTTYYDFISNYLTCVINTRSSTARIIHQKNAMSDNLL